MNNCSVKEDYFWEMLLTYSTNLFLIHWTRNLIRKDHLVNGVNLLNGKLRQNLNIIPQFLKKMYIVLLI